MKSKNTFNYQPWIDLLLKRKRHQTKEKILKEGLLDEDDYGRIVPPKQGWEPKPNSPDGSFYGLEAWTDNFCELIEHHPVYVDPHDAFSGRWMYFMSRMRVNKWNPDYPYDHLVSNIEKYDIISGIGDDAHFAPDYRIGLVLGWEGLINKIESYEKGDNTREQKAFYHHHKRAIRAIQLWVQHHIDEIERLIKLEKDEALRQNLMEMKDTNLAILKNPPKTFRQACQWIIWFHLASRTYNRDGAGGQLDEMLRPFYELDLKKERIDRNNAVYLLACFLLNDPIYWQLGGPDKDGKDQTSEISFLILEAADKMNTPLNLTIRVHDGLDHDLLRKSVEYLIKNKNGWPRFSGDKALVEGFVRNGFDIKLARQRIAVGCNWMSLPGMEYTMNDLVKINMAKVFEISFQELMDRNHSNKSTECLWESFEHHLSQAIRTAGDGIKHHLKYQKFNEPELLLNLLSHGPLEKGRDVSDGGAMFYNLAIDGAGLADVADSFSAIEQRIEQEEKITWKELNYHIESDFEGARGHRIQLLLKNSQKYGQNNSLGQKWALRIKESFTRLVREQSDRKNKQLFIPGFFSWANTVGFGKTLGATPNGRKSGAPISHGANPNPGFCMDGASLALASTIAQVQPGFGNTAPMQWELDPGLAREEHCQMISAIIRAHFEMGGTLINVNIIDKDKVLEAHKTPEKYPDLVVRVTGFTAYFSMLTPEFRQLVVDRILES